VGVVDNEAERTRGREVRAEPVQPVQDRERRIDVRVGGAAGCRRSSEPEQVGREAGGTVEQLSALRARCVSERRLEQLPDDAERELTLQLSGA
jgi:hypothetical protein